MNVSKYKISTHTHEETFAYTSDHEKIMFELYRQHFTTFRRVQKTLSPVMSSKQVFILTFPTYTRQNIIKLGQKQTSILVLHLKGLSVDLCRVSFCCLVSFSACRQQQKRSDQAEWLLLFSMMRPYHV